MKKEIEIKGEVAYISIKYQNKSNAENGMVKLFILKVGNDVNL